MGLPFPEHIGRYAIRDLVGRGGHSKVYEAWDDAHNRQVAVKLLDVDLAPTEALRVVRREVHTMGRFDGNPRIVTVYDHGLHEGQPFIVTTFYPQGSVAQMVEQQGPLRPEQVIQCCSDIALALEDVHRHDVVHRDLKPGNIFVSGYGFALGDFGISLQQSDDHSTSRRREMTIQYAPPEAFGDRPVQPAGDIYSLGATLYFMLAGHKPFRATDELALMREILDTTPDPVERDDVPGDLVELVAAMLSKRADDRPTAREVVGALAPQRLRDAMTPVTATVSSVPPRLEEPDPTRVAAPRSTRRWILPIGAVSVAGVAALGVGRFLDDGSAPAQTQPTTTVQAVAGDLPSISGLAATLDGALVRLAWNASGPAARYRLWLIDGPTGDGWFTNSTTTEKILGPDDLPEGLDVSTACFAVQAVAGSRIGERSTPACVGGDGS